MNQPPAETVRTDAEPPVPSPRSAVIAIAITAVAVLAVGLTIAWLRSGGAAEPASQGTELPETVEVPDLTLTATDGEPFPLVERLRGPVTLLYFGYLNCPDACPITMDVLSRALATRAAPVRDQVQVVFVTTDPDRDRPTDIRRYLDQFDKSFIGLTATPEDLAMLQNSLLSPVAVPERPDADGDYLVGHATAVYVFTPDGIARERYPFGTRQADWERIIGDYVDA
ncbi:MAG TPA: SCO family protein [Ilumatobacter sp.]|nr:SCO family protein [Ilumatobacter sp.]